MEPQGGMKSPGGLDVDRVSSFWGWRSFTGITIAIKSPTELGRGNHGKSTHVHKTDTALTMYNVPLRERVSTCCSHKFDNSQLISFAGIGCHSDMDYPRPRIYILTAPLLFILAISSTQSSDGTLNRSPLLWKCIENIGRSSLPQFLDVMYELDPEDNIATWILSFILFRGSSRQFVYSEGNKKHLMSQLLNAG